MKKVLIFLGGLLGLFFLLAALGGDPDWSMGLEYEARERVRGALRDPGSAQFRNVRVHPARPAESKAVCGEVNARNAFGGMAGWQRFIVVAHRGQNNGLRIQAPFLEENMRRTWLELEARYCIG